MGSELAALAVCKWKKLKTHITKYFAKITVLAADPGFELLPGLDFGQSSTHCPGCRAFIFRDVQCDFM